MPYWMSLKSRSSIRQTPSRGSLELRPSVDDEDQLVSCNDAQKTDHTAAASKRHDQNPSRESQPYISGISELSSTYRNKDTELAELRKENHDNATELAELRKENHDKKKQLADLRSEYQILGERNKAFADAYRSQELDIQNLSSAVAHADHDLQVTRTQLATCRDELRVCKDDLFRLQPLAQISDSSIEDDFNAVCRQVVGWIDKEMAEFERSHPNARPGQLFSPNGDPNIAQMMKNHLDFGEYLVRRSTHFCLLKMLFDKDMYLLGLSIDKRAFLRSAEKAMAKLDPPRDDATIRTWRSETLTALAATKDHVARRESQLRTINAQIHHTVSRNFPVLAVHAESVGRLYDQVTRPAADLADKIHTSSCDYRLEMPEDTATYQVPVAAEILNSFPFIDINSRKTLTPNSVVRSDRHGSIGMVLTPVEPALFRVNPGEESTVLRQTTYLIDLHFQLGKRN